MQRQGNQHTDSSDYDNLRFSKTALPLLCNLWHLVLMFIHFGGNCIYKFAFVCLSFTYASPPACFRRSRRSVTQVLALLFICDPFKSWAASWASKASLGRNNDKTYRQWQRVDHAYGISFSDALVLGSGHPHRRWKETLRAEETVSKTQRFWFLFIVVSTVTRQLCATLAAS